MAQATAAGRGGVGVIRLSGTRAFTIACELGRVPQNQTTFKPRTAHVSSWYSATNQCIDTGLTLYFPAPHSYTGESVVELQAHGGVVVLDWLVQRCVELGARLARPGEFSERAYLNGKLDLAQAEAVADLIDAASREAVLGAGRSLKGLFSDEITTLVKRVTAMRTHIEAAIDFVDEDLETNDVSTLSAKLTSTLDLLDLTLLTTNTGVRLQEGARLAIIGRPNVGKSSLLNALARAPLAIVSDTAGTTRDVIKERLVLKGVPIEIVDTAGLRVSEDPIEQEGVSRAEKALREADLVLWVFDAHTETPSTVEAQIEQYSTALAKKPVLRVGNKIDLIDPARREMIERYVKHMNPEGLLCSVLSDQDFDPLIQAILSQLGVRAGLEGQFMARRRHLEALQVARGHLAAAQTILGSQPLELAAEELRLAQEALGQITGAFTTDDLLGEIFSTFCIGK
ncbi:MAG: tRNA uridine-5-carboxymethylaminomethyl(34) synthesis GTPase MnmE [Gammaproteobacteria bacterium]